ncbi:hypothetical protein N8I74_10860 [Chitiniphilus purpureus]|uniref:Uncharacterized protein n=1 Tax=Chitiniphilus purpureus TaxID=2981137 RepID=A0ABY6DHK2_9NEIS|nr:hypothetical protein [Chitiniphilus sp. CD1]UXY13822.1 hypothetical protein N8I74_10860 [Chitiniphilus sp. CD1]
MIRLKTYAQRGWRLLGDDRVDLIACTVLAVASIVHLGAGGLWLGSLGLAWAAIRGRIAWRALADRQQPPMAAVREG